ncbi:MAG: GntR family transcriptional regulator [Hyphomonadaceae bacterium]|nr:GntR family transcriptional regulator [Hyphomonadaceae bacterium]
MNDEPIEEQLNSSVYAELRRRLITGRMRPGHEMSTRTLAAELGVSQTPVRDALSRLAAEGAVAIRSKRRVLVPYMTQARMEDILRCRLALEPEAAALATPSLLPEHIERLKQADRKLDGAIAHGDADAYIDANYTFHFTFYLAQPGATMLQLIEALWLQYGPFMRHAFDKVAHARLNDSHQEAICAAMAGDAAGVKAAIAQDIADGMKLIASHGLGLTRT